MAGDVCRGDPCESTVASTDPKIANAIAHLFQDDSFRIQTSTDISTVELCGALKNIVAMGAGFCDALGYGYSSKAAIVREGLHEIAEFCKLFYKNFDQNTMFESCGVGDLVVRNCFHIIIIVHHHCHYHIAGYLPWWQKSQS